MTCTIIRIPKNQVCVITVIRSILFNIVFSNINLSKQFDLVENNDGMTNQLFMWS